jgi:hypothetical protein
MVCLGFPRCLIGPGPRGQDCRRQRCQKWKLYLSGGTLKHRYLWFFKIFTYQVALWSIDIFDFFKLFCLYVTIKSNLVILALLLWPYVVLKFMTIPFVPDYMYTLQIQKSIFLAFWVEIYQTFNDEIYPKSFRPNGLCFDKIISL